MPRTHVHACALLCRPGVDRSRATATAASTTPPPPPPNGTNYCSTAARRAHPISHSRLKADQAPHRSDNNHPYTYTRAAPAGQRQTNQPRATCNLAHPTPPHHPHTKKCRRGGEERRGQERKPRTHGRRHRPTSPTRAQWTNALISRLESRSLSELTRQIAPPTKNGHAPPTTKSRKSSQSVNPHSVRPGHPIKGIQRHVDEPTGPAARAEHRPTPAHTCGDYTTDMAYRRHHHLVGLTRQCLLMATTAQPPQRRRRTCEPAHQSASKRANERAKSRPAGQPTNQPTTLPQQTPPHQPNY
ncbi:Cytochrome P450 likeTBP [Echinococcus multilocularis]|uniref:Cytochrome P450 likeTBP n=1 Tax=Echinococcus multilocularis TaxID=6211 RepID=A0A068XUP9_ECHMU|nr:Cytochrome P450 likeTBP [Echinococcus multilocularis]